MVERIGGWIQTYTGGKIYPLDARADEIDISDIAHSLSMQCRYNGHCETFYSVAEHCVLLSRLVDPENAFAALMHDASEAYLTDIPRPIKPGLLNYKEIENKLMNVIALKYGFTWPPPLQVTEYDMRILNDEREQNMWKSIHEWDDYGEKLGVELKFWSPEKAEQKFINAFIKLRPNISPEIEV